MRHGVGFAPAGWRGWAVVALFVVVLTVVSVLVSALVADPIRAGLALMVAAGLLAAVFLLLIRRLAGGG